MCAYFMCHCTRRLPHRYHCDRAQTDRGGCDQQIHNNVAMPQQAQDTGRPSQIARSPQTLTCSNLPLPDAWLWPHTTPVQRENVRAGGSITGTSRCGLGTPALARTPEVRASPRCAGKGSATALGLLEGL